MTRQVVEGLTKRNASKQQLAIFREFETGSGNVILDARAGCGKTTTVLAGIDLAPESDILMCAFNKVIAKELATRLKNPRAKAQTLHSLGCGIVFGKWGKVPINENGERGRSIVAKVVGSDDSEAGEALRVLVYKLTSLAKSVAPFARSSDVVDIIGDFDHWMAVEELLALSDEGFDELEEEAQRALVEAKAREVAKHVLGVMQLSAEFDGSIDFDDMVWLPVRMKWARPRFSLVVVDECQDMNATQILLARSVCRGRLIVVGDPHQAIYGFRGADSDSMDRLRRELRAKRLGLTITYRCPQAIVREAQKLVPDFQAAPTAPEGVVRDASYAQALSQARPGDFILSRKNAPLVKTCLALLRDGRRAVVRGRDVGKGLRKLVERQHVATVAELLPKLNAWKETTIANLVAAKAHDSKIENINDQVEAITELSFGAETVQHLLANLDNLFSDNGVDSSIVCSSVHKAKGLESKTVFLLTDTLYPGRRVEDPEEKNIHYVAITRAKRELVLVKGLGKAS